MGGIGRMMSFQGKSSLAGYASTPLMMIQASTDVRWREGYEAPGEDLGGHHLSVEKGCA